MKLEELKKKNLPDIPGVYIFKCGKEIVYIGKATSLQDRVASYFRNDIFVSRGRLIVDMVAIADNVEYTETDSVLEALILEANLIKKHQPRYNTKEKDNKSFNYVVITKEDFPRVLLIRGRALVFKNQDDLEAKKLGSYKLKAIYGPFPQGAALKEGLKIIRKIFPYRDEKCVPKDEQKNPDNPKPCFNRQIRLCPGVCTGEISKEEYKDVVQNIRLFFEGRKKQLVRKLEKEMKDFAKSQEFEKANRVKRQLFALTHIQDVALIKEDLKDPHFTASHAGKVFRIEAYDIAHISGASMVGVMVVVEDGEAKKSDYRKFKIRQVKGVNDIASLGEVLRRRFNHPEWQIPDVIVVDGGIAQINAARGILSELNLKIPIVSVVKDERHKAREIMGETDIIKEDTKSVLLANSEAHRFAIAYHRKSRGKFV